MLLLLACTDDFPSKALPDGQGQTDTGTADTADTGDRADTADTADSGDPVDTSPPPPQQICEPWATPADAYDQSVVPVEVDAVGNVTKIVLVAGASSDHPTGQHEFFAITALLATVLCETPGIAPVIVRDGWPTDPAIFNNAAAIVFYADGGDRHPLADAGHLATMQGLLASGVGFANLHYAVEYPTSEESAAIAMLGGTYEQGYSINPYWRAEVGSTPDHPVTHGVPALSIEDEWYYNMRWGDTAVTPLLQAVPPDSTRTTPDTAANPGRTETIAWAFNRADGGRSFGFTGGHWYANWTDSADTLDADMQRRIVVQGMLWAAGVDIPDGGVPVDLDPTLSGLFLDTR